VTTAFLLHHLLTEAAERAPESPAVRCGGETWTYERLDRESNGVASALRELGVRPRDRVGLLLPKGPEALAAVYGILKSGAAFVPLDPLDPIVHAAAVAGDADLACLVSSPERVADLMAIDPEATPAALLVDESGLPSELPSGIGSIAYADAVADAAEPAEAAITDGDLACLLYTSGSTGRPKGVMHTHHAALTVAEWYVRTMRIGPQDRLALHPPLHFILSAYGVFPAARAGAVSVVLPLERGFRGKDLARAIRDEGITVWISVPAPLRMLSADAGEGDLDSLRLIGIGGGALAAPDARAIRAHAPALELWHFYGATEVWGVFHHRIDGDPAGDGPVSIGRPQGNTDVLVVAPDGSPVPSGLPGELHVRGPKVMKGYWGDPAGTAAVLVADPLGRFPGELVYRTGDLVRECADGVFEYVGRLDHMVKSRGYRIELGEIEAALTAHRDAHDAVAIAVPHAEWGSAVVAFVEPQNGVRPTPAELRGFLAARLPAYMLPERIEVLDVLPRTASGKPDRRRLAAAETGAIR
jgi:amino acid adenylation domain-containing protein